jgi:hypothetical protein
MITADNEAAEGLNVHHGSNHCQRQKCLVAYGTEEYQKDTDIATQTNPLAISDLITHEAVEFIRCIAQHEGTNNSQESNQ